MRHASQGCLLALVLGGGIVGHARADGPTGRPACVQVTGEAYARGYGYYHVVVVTNQCERTARCLVSSDVDPQPEHPVVVERSSTVRVTTRTNSPASTFEPRARCELEGSSAGPSRRRPDDGT
jgi:hypothetical protein